MWLNGCCIEIIVEFILLTSIYRLYQYFFVIIFSLCLVDSKKIEFYAYLLLYIHCCTDRIFMKTLRVFDNDHGEKMWK